MLAVALQLKSHPSRYSRTCDFRSDKLLGCVGVAQGVGGRMCRIYKHVSACHLHSATFLAFYVPCRWAPPIHPARGNPLAISHRLKQSRAWFLSFPSAAPPPHPAHDYILLHDNLLSSPRAFLCLLEVFPPRFRFGNCLFRLFWLVVNFYCSPCFSTRYYFICQAQWLFWLLGNERSFPSISHKVCYKMQLRKLCTHFFPS